MLKSILENIHSVQKKVIKEEHLQNSYESYRKQNHNGRGKVLGVNDSM